MVIIDQHKLIITGKGRGRFGYQQIDRDNGRTYAEALAENPYAGVYQAKVTLQGKKISQMNWRFGSNPQTVAQQAWRAVFTAGVTAYHALSPTDLEKWRLKGMRRKMTGYNAFLSQYLKTHLL